MNKELIKLFKLLLNTIVIGILFFVPLIVISILFQFAFIFLFNVEVNLNGILCLLLAIYLTIIFLKTTKE